MVDPAQAGVTYSLPLKCLIAVSRLLYAVDTETATELGLSTEDQQLSDAFFDNTDEFLTKTIGDNWLGYIEDAENEEAV